MHTPQLILGMDCFDEFGFDGISQSMQKIYSSVFASIRPYLDKFMPLLTHSDSSVRRYSLCLLTYFPNKAPRLLSTVLNSLEVVVEQIHEVHTDYLWDTKRILINSSPSIEEIKRFIILHYKMHNLGLQRHKNDLVYRNENSLAVIQDLVKELSLAHPN